MNRRVIASLLAVLSVMAIIPFNTVIVHSQGISLISYEWKSSSGDNTIYPGSQRVSLIVELQNNESYNISNVQGCFIFPSGISPFPGLGICRDATTLNGTIKPVYQVGEIFRIDTLINIDKDLPPGTYGIGLNITYTVLSSNRERESSLINFTLVVSDYPIVNIRVSDAWWGSDKVFPGTSGAVLYVRIENFGESNVESGEATFTLSPLRPQKIKSPIPSINSEESAVLQLTGIDIPANVNPGSYRIYMDFKVTASTSDGVTYSFSGRTFFYVGVSQPEAPDLVVVDSGWIGGIGYNESKELTLYVTMRNLDHSRIDSIVAILELPEGMTARDGKNYIVATYTTPVFFGDVFTLRFPGINTSLSNTGELKFELKLSIVASYNNAEYYVNSTYLIRANTSSEKLLHLTETRWVYGGTTARALPTSKGIILELRFVNTGPDTVTSITPSIALPSGFRIDSYGGSCLSGVAGASACTLQVQLDIDASVAPGNYESILHLYYIVRSGNSLLFGEDTFTVSLNIDNPAQYFPDIQLSNVRWGTATPQTAYPGGRQIPAHIEIVNLGRYTARNIYVSAFPINSSVRIIANEKLCAATLPSGGSCTFTPYLDLGDATQGKVILSVNVEYAVTEYGSFILQNQTFLVSLPIEKYAAQYLGDIVLTEASWASNYPVYPETENATLMIRLANHYPYNIASLTGRLTLPEGMRVSGPMNLDYVSGPIAPNQEVMLTYRVSVGDVPAGIYEASLELSYIIQSGGSSVLRNESIKIPIQINQVRRGIEVVTTGWYGVPPQPGTYGNLMYIVLRNNDFPVVKGAVADIRLPPGFTNAINNGTEVKLPLSSSLPQLPAGNVNPSGGIEQIIKNLVGAPLQPAITFSEGDFLYLILPINIQNVSLGEHILQINLTFFDQWNNIRTLPFQAKFVVPGSSLLVKVWADTPLDFSESRNTTLPLNIVNLGSASIYNVYLYIYSPVSTILPKSLPVYIDELKPYERKVLNLSVYYNPYVSQQAAIPITYGNMPFMAGVMYTDVLGNRHTYNISFTVSVQPFIELKVDDLKAVKEGSSIRISGTITNLGNAPAQRITARIKIGSFEGDSYFVGDLDPSSQTSFSVSTIYEKPVTSVTLVLEYRNPYNEIEIMEINTSLKEYPTTTTTPPPQTPWFDIYRLGTALAVILFLILIAIMLRKYLKQHPVPEEPIDVEGL